MKNQNGLQNLNKAKRILLAPSRLRCCLPSPRSRATPPLEGRKRVSTFRPFRLLLFPSIFPMEHWAQNYDPLASPVLSTIVAALPVVVLLSAIALFRIRIHFSALLGLGVALAVALGAYGMPLRAAAATTLYGAAYGLFPIG